MNKNKTIPKPNKKDPETKIPYDLRKALENSSKAQAQWSSLTQISRRDFISWIESAKQAETRKRRIEVACSKLIAGKRRPCCYAIVPMDLYRALGKNPKAKSFWITLSPNERRDISDWVEDAKDKNENKKRIKKACIMLEAGKRQP